MARKPWPTWLGAYCISVLIIVAKEIALTTWDPALFFRVADDIQVRPIQDTLFVAVPRLLLQSMLDDVATNVCYQAVSRIEQQKE